MRSNAREHVSSLKEEERQIHRTQETRPERGEQDIADKSLKTGVREIVMSIVLGSDPCCYTHLQYS